MHKIVPLECVCELRCSHAENEREREIEREREDREREKERIIKRDIEDKTERIGQWLWLSW